LRGKTVAAALVVFGACLLSMGGCVSQTEWRYTPDTYPARSEPLADKALAIPPFRDTRPNENELAVWPAFIPLMPYGWADYSVPPDNLFGGPANFAEHFAQKAAEELKASGLFRDVFLAQRASEGQLVLIGTLQSTRNQSKIITYGVSVLAPFPWLLGLPVATRHLELVIHLSLQERSTRREIWRKTFAAKHDESPIGLYYNNSVPDDAAYDLMFKDMMRDCVKSLESALLQQHGG